MTLYRKLNNPPPRELDVLSTSSQALGIVVDHAERRTMLDPDVASSVAEMGWSTKDMLVVLPELHLPHNTAWYEWPEACRAQFLSSLLGEAQGMSILEQSPAEVGLYATSEPGTRGRAGKVVAAWRHHGEDFAHTSRLALKFDLRTNELEGAPFRSPTIPDVLTRHFRLVANPMVHPAEISCFGSPDRIIQLFGNDVIGEIPMFLGLLAMPLMQRAFLEQDVQPSIQLNESRRRRGKAPLLPYRRVTMRLECHKAVSQPRGAEIGERAPVRRHFVKGHFKKRATGVYYWNPYARGVGPIVPRDTHVRR